MLSYEHLKNIEPKNFEKLRTAQPEPKFTGSYKKKRLMYLNQFEFCTKKLW